MSIHYMHRDGDVVEVEGSPMDVMIPVMDGTGYQCAIVGGLTIVRATAGKHNGGLAQVFTLCDETGIHELGRLAVLDDAPFEWYEVYESPELAEARVKRWEAERLVNRRIVETELDFAWDGYDSIELGMAETAAEFGVSVTLVKEHGPGGGWPVIKVTGLREKVEHLLRKGWQMGDQEITDAIGNGN